MKSTRLSIWCWSYRRSYLVYDKETYKIDYWYLDNRTSERVRKNLLDKLDNGELEGIDIDTIDELIRIIKRKI